MCEDNYEEDELIIRCNTCDRWSHGECDSILTEEDAEICAEQTYVCQMCRPIDQPPPHHIVRQKEAAAAAAKAKQDKAGGGAGGSKDATRSSRSPSPDYAGGYSSYSNATFMVDGVMLTERGVNAIKAQTVEKEKKSRRRRGDKPGAPGAPADNSMDNSMDADADGPDDADEEGGASGAGAGSEKMPPGNYKDGDLVKPLADGRAPEPPDGFSIVTKENGQMFLRKRRYRDLKKVGIGGFQAKTRTPSRKPKEGEAGGPEGEGGADGKPKKRPAWRPKKNKLLLVYPEYIPDSFFGREAMEALKGGENLEEMLDEQPYVEKEDRNALTLTPEIIQALERAKKEEAKQKAEAEAKAKEERRKARRAKKEAEAKAKEEKEKREKAAAEAKAKAEEEAKAAAAAAAAAANNADMEVDMAVLDDLGDEGKLKPLVNGSIAFVFPSIKVINLNSRYEFITFFFVFCLLQNCLTTSLTWTCSKGSWMLVT